MYTEEKHRELAQVLETKFSPLDRTAGEWVSRWEEISTFVRPESGKHYTGRSRPELYDGTAIQALESFAAGVHSQLTSPTERWFSFTIAGRSESDVDKDEQIWLEEASDAVYSALALPRASFDTALSEVYAEVGALGTGCLYQEEAPHGFRFQAFPLHSIRCAENSKGVIDTVFRKYQCTGRQMKQEWPWVVQHERLSKIEDSAEREVQHVVFPRTDPEAVYFFGSKNMEAGHEFVSVYWMPSEKIILSIGGYRTQPYHVARWKKRVGKVFGEGPGHVALPDIKMVNAMSKELILSAELANKPPLFIDDDSMLSPLKHIVPGASIYMQPGSRLPTPMVSGSQPQFAQNEIDERRKMIDSAFFTDLFFRGKKKERQSVLEIQDDRSELTRQLTPMFGRLQAELLTPVLVRSLEILIRQGRVKMPPKQYGGFNPLDIEYTNSATKAQLHGKAFAIGQLFADLAPMAQVDPSIMEVVDWREAAMQMAVARDVSPKIIKSKAEVEKARAAREQAQAQAGQMQNAVAASQAVKNIAGARSIDPNFAR